MLPLFELHGGVTSVTDDGIGLMRLMTRCTFKVVRFSNMVVVRIEFVSPGIPGSLGDRIP